ncbi:MAG: DUF2589 domain-containing protein [Nitrospirota bacterium]
MDDEKGEDSKEWEKFEGGLASETIISLSQALLAPLDAIFKAQLHGARSFLNLLLQLGFPHKPIDEGGVEIPEKKEGLPEPPLTSPEKKETPKELPYNLEFHYEAMIDGKVLKRKVSIPALALVPVAPLAVESAGFKFGMMVKKIERHRQIQGSEAKAVDKEKDHGYNRHKRPWFLVDDPISMQGIIAPSGTMEGAKETTQESTIQIEVKVGKMMIPAGLDKLLTSLTQTSYVSEVKEEGK